MPSPRVPAFCMAAAFALAGCSYSPGGAGASNDVHTYVSTSHLPTTVSVLDTRTGEKTLTVEVPVGQQLVLSFHDHDDDEATGRANLNWALMPAGNSWGSLSNRTVVAPQSARRIELSYRRAPEFQRPLAQVKPEPVPAGVVIADAPKPAPAPAPAAPEPKPSEPQKAPVDLPE